MLVPSRDIPQSKDSWLKMEIFSNKFVFLRSNYNSKAISTCYNVSDALSHVELRVVSLAQISYTVVNGTLTGWLVLWDKSWFFTARKWLNKKKYFAVNTKKT